MNSTASAEGENAAPPASSRRLLYVAICIAVAWWIVLGSLAARFSNPIVVNRRQIAESVLVLAVRPHSAGGNQFEVEDALGSTGFNSGDTVTIFGLREPPSDAVIVPLTVASGGFRVTPVPTQHGPVNMVYPLTPETGEQVRQLLADLRSSTQSQDARAGAN